MKSSIPHDDPVASNSRSASSMLADYGLAIAAIAAALILTLLVRHTTGNPTFFAFYVAIFLSVWFGGRGPGWLAAALALIALNSLFRSTDDLLTITGEKLPTVLAFIICVVTAESLERGRNHASGRAGDHTANRGRVCEWRPPGIPRRQAIHEKRWLTAVGKRHHDLRATHRRHARTAAKHLRQYRRSQTRGAGAARERRALAHRV